MKSEIIEFLPEHIDYMALRGGQHDKCAMIEGLKRANNMLAFTLMADGVPVLCAGSTEILPYVAELWLVCSEDFDRLKKTCATTIADGLIPFKERYDRLQVMIKAGDDRAARFANWLGFECEGCLRKYVDGADYYIYGWVQHG